MQSQGDLWYFPPGIPHSLQATNDDPDGAEFLLVSPQMEHIFASAETRPMQVFDDGDFSEDSTFQVWHGHAMLGYRSAEFWLL